MGLAMPLDFVTMFGGGGLAGAVIKGTAKKALGQKIFQKTIADKAMKSRAIKLLEKKGLDKTLASDIFDRVIGSGSQFAAYEGAKGGVGAALNGEDVKQGVWHGVVHGGAVGGVLGATTGFMGNFYKELGAAKNIKSGKLFPKTPGLSGPAKGLETRTINTASKTNKYLNWSDDAIDKWMKFTGPGAQFGAEVGVLTGSSQLDRYKAGEDLTWGNVFNDAFFNIGFVGTMVGGRKALGSAKKAIKARVNKLTKEEQYQKDYKDKIDNLADEVTKDLDIDAENASTPEGAAVTRQVKKNALDIKKNNEYNKLREEGIGWDEAMKRVEFYDTLMKDTKSMDTNEILRWKKEMKGVADVLNAGELAIEQISKKNKDYGFTLEEIAGMKSDIQNYRKSLENLLHKKRDIKAEEVKTESLEKTKIINFLQTEGPKQAQKAGIEYKPTIIEGGVQKEVPMNKLAGLSLEQLQSIESGLKQSGIKRVKIVKEGEVPYENIELEVESKGLLNKDIKSELPTTDKNIIIDSNLGEVNKNILAYSAEKLKTLRGTTKDATKQAKDVLEYSQKNYKTKDIRNLSDSQKKSLIADYINDYFGFPMVNKKTGQTLKESQIFKYFKNDNVKTKHAMKEATRVINLLKEHFHQEGGIKDIIGFDLMKPQGKLLKGWQPGKIAQRELTIAGGKKGLTKLSQWVKNSFKDYKSSSGKTFSKEEVSLMMKMATEGKMRPGEVPSALVKDINVRAGTIEVRAPGKQPRTSTIGIELARKIQNYAKKNKLKQSDKLFVEDAKQFNEVLKEVYKQAPNKLIPLIKDLYAGKFVPYDATLKTPIVKVGKLTLGGQSYTSRLQESSIFRRLFGEGGVDLGHAEGRGEAQARESYKKAGDAPVKSPFVKEKVSPTVQKKTVKKINDKLKSLDKQAKKLGYKSAEQLNMNFHKIENMKSADKKLAKRILSEHSKLYKELKGLSESNLNKITDKGMVRLEETSRVQEIRTAEDIKRAEQQKISDARKKGEEGVEPTTPPTKGLKRQTLIDAMKTAQDRHQAATKQVKGKQSKALQKQYVAEKDVIIDALSEGSGAFLIKPQALEYIAKHKKTHVDILKTKGLTKDQISEHKGWIKTYDNIANTISKGFEGQDRFSVYDPLTSSAVNINKAHKIGYAARDYYIKETGLWKKGMSKSEKSKHEERLIKESVIDSDKYNLRRISELSVNQIQELVESVNARATVKTNSRFANREAKFLKHVKDTYKDLSYDDITIMLADLGVKDGAFKNIKRLDTFDRLQGLIDGSYAKMPKIYTTTSHGLRLTDPDIVLPPLKSTSKVWHGLASLLLRNKHTEPIGQLLLKSDVKNTYHKRWGTETIESVIPKLKEAGFSKSEAYMFMFINKKMYTGENAKFVSAREQQFINMLTDKKPNPINVAKGEIRNMYKRYWDEARKTVQNAPWASKMRKADFEAYLNQKFIEDYYTKRVTPEVLKALMDRKGPTFLNLLNKNIEMDANKLKRKTDKSGKFTETKTAFDLRKAKYKKSDSLRKKIIKDLDRWFFSTGTRLDFNFMKDRKFDLPRKVVIEVKNKKGETAGTKEVNSYIEKFDANVGYYSVGMSKMLSTLEFFPEFTKIGQKFGGGNLNRNFFELMNAKSADFGINQEWANYIKIGLENHLGLNSDIRSRENAKFKRGMGIMSSTSAAIGLSSPTSGLKNLAIGIPRSIGHFGLTNTVKAAHRFFTNHEDLQSRDLNWVKDYGSKQLVLEAQETVFEKLPWVGQKLTMENLFNLNQMTRTEGFNRIVSSYAGNMAFEQMTSAYHGRGKAGVLMMGGKKEIERAYKDVWKLSEKESKYMTETPYENLQTKNKDLMDFITLKVQHYSHVSTQGSTSSALLPKWMSGDYARPLTLFQRMAWSTTNDIRTNYIEPAFRLQNPMPLLRATAAHGLSGYGLYLFYDWVMGYEVPEQLDDNALKRVLPYLWRSEFFGLFGELVNPHSSFLYDKNKGPLDLFGGDATQARGLLEPVIIRNAQVLRENAFEIFKAVFPGDFAGKQTKLARQAMKDIVTNSIVVAGQAARITDNWRSSDLKSHRQLKQISREFMKDKGRTFPRVMIENFRSPYYRDLKDSFWHKNEQEWARSYWNAYNFLVTEYQNDGFTSNAAHKKAKKAIKSSLSYMNPVKQFSEDKKGRVMSKRAEYLNYLKEKAPDKYKEAIRLEREFEFRMRKIDSIVHKYRKRYSVLPHGPTAKYTGKYFGIY